MSFEVYILPGVDEPRMSYHLFVAILSEYLQGNKDAAEVREAIEVHLSKSLSDDEAQDIVDTLTYINGGATASIKRNRLDEVYRTFVAAGEGVWYNTQPLLRARLNWSTPA